MTGVLEKWIPASRDGNFHSPWFCKRVRIVDRELVQKRVGIKPLETFGQPHIFARATESSAVREVRRLDDERVAFPMASRVSFQLANLLRKMRPVFEWNDADVVNHLNQNRHVSGTLNNSNIVVVRSRKHWGPCECPSNAALCQPPALRTIEFTSAVRSKSLRLSLSPCRRQRRNLSVIRIDDQRRPPCCDDLRSSIPPKVVIRTTHISFSRAVATVHIVLLSY